MTTLILVRHAKSEWDLPAGVSDHDRPLNARGTRDAPVMAARLASDGPRVEAIVASTALRARTTAGVFAEVLRVPLSLSADLYGAGPDTLVRHAASAGVDSVAVVAHDPGLSALAGELSEGRIGHMPTCAVAVFEWDTDDWDVATATPPQSWRFDQPRDN